MDEEKEGEGNVLFSLMQKPQRSHRNKSRFFPIGVNIFKVWTQNFKVLKIMALKKGFYFPNVELNLECYQLCLYFPHPTGPSRGKTTSVSHEWCSGSRFITINKIPTVFRHLRDL